MHLTQRLDASFYPISDETRIKDLKEVAVRGNHQSTILHSDVLISNVKKETRTCFQFYFRLGDVFKIKEATVASLGMIV